MMKKQTAVEFLVEHIGTVIVFDQAMRNKIAEALEMERQQIIDAWAKQVGYSTKARKAAGGLYYDLMYNKKKKDEDD